MRNSIFSGIGLLTFCVCLNGCVTTNTDAPATDLMTNRANLAASHAIETYDANGPGAAYVISKNGIVLASGGIGIADMEWGLQNTDKTVFRLGSISKTITAIAVLQLVEKDLLDLNQPISAYAPDLPKQMGAVTMRQLMSHRSGLAEHVWNPDLLPFIWQPMTTQQVIDLQQDAPIDFAPGEKYNYVNFNYVVVAHIIERVTDKTFVNFINDFFAEQAMPNSHYDWHDAIIQNRAEFYDERDGVILNSQEVDLTHVSAAGALMSSAMDMARWSQLLAENKLISKTALAEAWTPAPLPDGTATEYGLGFNVSELAGERLIWHNGLTPGSQSAFGYTPESGIFIAVLSNGFYLPSTTKLMEEMMTIMVTGALPDMDAP